MAKSTRKGTAVTSNISRRRENARAEGGNGYVEKRRELVSIAANLFKENGYKATTLAHIGERAGLDRATVYYYVGSKEELFQTSIEGSLDENLNAAEALLLDKQKSARAKIQALLVALMRSYERYYPQMYVYIQEQMHQIKNDPSKWAKEVQRKTRRLEAIMGELIESGVAAGELRSDVDARLAVRGLFGMVNWTHRWYKPGSSTSAEQVAESFASIFFDGMKRGRS